MGPSPSVDPRVCVILPTYNNAETLESVVRGILERGIPMIVVNDGATDDTSAVLERVGDVDVIRHTVNRGKGAAIRTGLDAAVERGFTHAITMDTDGQHLTEDLPRIMAAIQESPNALIVGIRDLRGGGPRLKSRMLRLNSNFWSWLETGTRTGDSQSGFRGYPLQIVKQLHLGTQRYDFEIEVLVKALWLGVPLRQVSIAVRYDTGNRSHFRPLRDFARVSWLNCQLMAWRLLVPQPMREVLVQQAYHDQPRAERWRWFARRYFTIHSGEPSRVGLAVGVGVCFGILPIWGAQTLAALAVAEWLRLNRALVLAASNISFGAMSVVIVVASTLVGRAIYSADPSVLFEIPNDTAQFGAWIGEYLLGSLVLAGAAGVSFGGLAFVIAMIGKRASAHRREASEP